MRGRKASQGFTLIELLIVIVLLAIFALFAIPAFTTMVNNNRVQSSAAEFKSMLLSARTDAVTKRASVTVSRSGANAQVWTTEQGGETTRTLTLPAAVAFNPSVTTIVFKPDGTATAANIGVASSYSDAAYGISVTQVGLIKSVKATPPADTDTDAEGASQ